VVEVVVEVVVLVVVDVVVVVVQLALNPVQELPSPKYCPLISAHWLLVMSVHAPLPKQQPPSGGRVVDVVDVVDVDVVVAHVIPKQLEPRPKKIPP
jgi:hypothetical protein